MARADVSYCTGTYKSGVGSQSCPSCNPGTYLTAVASTSPSSCIPCPSAKYQSNSASTACFSCDWGSLASTGVWVYSSDTVKGDTPSTGCVCAMGSTGQGYGFIQDTISLRPDYSANGGRLKSGSITFSAVDSKFMQYPGKKTWNISGNGGLTIVADVKFVGDAGNNERIIDFGDALYRYDDSIVLSRWQDSDQLYFAITNKVTLLCRRAIFLRCILLSRALFP